jgi:hypothetical protein
MTADERTALLERRAKLLPLYADPESDEQAVEVARELYFISELLRATRPLPAPKKKPRGRSFGWKPRRDGRAAAAGNDE